MLYLNRTRELKEQLELAQEELATLKDARNRQAEMVSLTLFVLFLTFNMPIMTAADNKFCDNLS